MGKNVYSPKHYKEQTTPSNPPSGFRAIYAKSDGFYEKDSSGVEIRLNTKPEKSIVLKCILDDQNLTTGDGKARLTIPVELNGFVISTVGCHVYTASTSGLPSIQLHNETDAVDILTTNMTIDVNEIDTSTATTPSVINSSNATVSTADVIRVDVDASGTGTLGLEVRIGLTK